MKSLQLDFSNLKQRNRQQSNLVLIVLLVLFTFGLIFEHSRITRQSANIESSIASSQTPKSVKQAMATEQDLRKIKMARAVQKNLNFPWNKLLSSLEAVKQQSRTISLMVIQPNPAKAEILISGEASDLKAMLAFVSLLERQPVFSDVFLVNQRRLGIDKNDLAFTLKMRWQV